MSFVNLDDKPINAEDDAIEINLVACVQQDTYLDKHTKYKIQGKDKIGAFEVERRYKDFSALREILLQKWPGCFVPGIPGRKLFQGNDVKTTSERARFLQQFCNKIKLLPNLYYSQEFSQHFLRSKEKEIYKLFVQMEKPKTAELIQKYHLNFIQLQGRDIDAALHKNIEHFVEKLKTNHTQLKQAKKYVREVTLSQDAYNKGIEKIMITQLPNYEKLFISIYSNNYDELLLFTNQLMQKELEEKYQQNVIFKRTIINQLYEYIKSEIKDIKGFYQCLRIKKEYEDQKKKLEQKIVEFQQEISNLNEGKSNFFKNLFNKQTPEQLKSHLNVQIQTTQNEMENYSNLIDIMNAIIGFIEIDRYQETKQILFKQLLKQIQQFEQIIIQEQIQYWEYIQKQAQTLITKFSDNREEKEEQVIHEQINHDHDADAEQQIQQNENQVIGQQENLQIEQNIEQIEELDENKEQNKENNIQQQNDEDEQIQND